MSCAECPRTAKAPRTAEGIACVRAAVASVGGGGMAGPGLDVAGALALATAWGVPAPVAADLVAAAAEGFLMGEADRAERKE